jgi:STE24 endopeptidase
MHPFTTAFVFALALGTGLKLYLAHRHIHHVLANRSAVPADFASAVTVEAHQKAADYTCARTRLGALASIVDAGVLLLLTLGGGLAAIDHAVSKAISGGIMRDVALVAAVATVVALIDLPFSVYRTFRIETRFGFNTMTAKLFVIDLLKSVLISALLGLPLIACILWLMNRAGDHWWLYAWSIWVAFNLLVLMLYPSLIAPLFNRFSPLQDEDLKVRTEGLLARCGFRPQGFFVMDGSKRSTHGNAYFTGFGRSKRIVFFDTLIARLTHAEIEAVLAHELGHFKHRHVIKRMLLIFAFSLGFFWLLGQLMLTPWFYQALGVSNSSTAMALVLFFLVGPVFTFLAQPLAGYYSRRHEFEADQFAVRHASGADLKRALVKLYQDNATTLTPDPWHSAFYDSHPPATQRAARLEPAVRNT